MHTAAMGLKLRLNQPGHQYQLLDDDTVVSFEVYIDDGKIWEFIHTRTVPGHEHQGYATQLVQRALDDMRAHGRQVLPYCPFVRDFIARHTEYVDLVPVDARPSFGLNV